mmetsp:Transcript_85119/g.237516  ORF Transcript_85119/g.237516 Transcript_85119/m.237516 type:complete len:224 (-) Transcript_85119:536-1207(-)
MELLGCVLLQHRDADHNWLWRLRPIERWHETLHNFVHHLRLSHCGTNCGEGRLAAREILRGKGSAIGQKCDRGAVSVSRKTSPWLQDILRFHRGFVFQILAFLFAVCPLLWRDARDEVLRQKARVRSTALHFTHRLGHHLFLGERGLALAARLLLERRHGDYRRLWRPQIEARIISHLLGSLHSDGFRLRGCRHWEHCRHPCRAGDGSAEAKAPQQEPFHRYA